MESPQLRNYASFFYISGILIVLPLFVMETNAGYLTKMNHNIINPKQTLELYKEIYRILYI